MEMSSNNFDRMETSDTDEDASSTDVNVLEKSKSTRRSYDDNGSDSKSNTSSSSSSSSSSKSSSSTSEGSSSDDSSSSEESEKEDKNGSVLPMMRPKFSPAVNLEESLSDEEESISAMVNPKRSPIVSLEVSSSDADEDESVSPMVSPKRSPIVNLEVSSSDEDASVSPMINPKCSPVVNLEESLSDEDESVSPMVSPKCSLNINLEESLSDETEETYGAQETINEFKGGNDSNDPCSSPNKQEDSESVTSLTSIDKTLEEVFPTSANISSFVNIDSTKDTKKDLEDIKEKQFETNVNVDSLQNTNFSYSLESLTRKITSGEMSCTVFGKEKDQNKTVLLSTKNSSSEKLKTIKKISPDNDSNFSNVKTLKENTEHNVVNIESDVEVIAQLKKTFNKYVESSEITSKNISNFENSIQHEEKFVSHHMKSISESSEDCDPPKRAQREKDLASTSQKVDVCGGDSNDFLPIQAEVIMSEGSESDLKIESNDNDVEIKKYVESFVGRSFDGGFVEYPPSNNEVPNDGSDLTQWQLENVRLPPYVPDVSPPSWLRLTIPPEGYPCKSCGDIFFIQESLGHHLDRRSILISLECGPCDAKLTFYNRCALRNHLREHLLRGEAVDEETVEVRTLPLQLSKLLQPIRVPVPNSLKPLKKGEKRKLNSELLPSLIKSSDQNNKSTIRCFLCERLFQNVRELMSHMKTDQPSSDQKVECRKCKLVLPSVCAAKAHVLTHMATNSSSLSVCPECGSCCSSPRDFVNHLNACGHQFRRSGFLCSSCEVCFFKDLNNFIAHWIKEHCVKSYECAICNSTFDSPAFHNCSNLQASVNFYCLMSCPRCLHTIRLSNHNEKDMFNEVKNHLVLSHSILINRVYYIYKSKFCINAFRSKDELRAHHDREHRRDNHYRTKICSLHHDVLGYQQQYFSGQEPRNAHVSLHAPLSTEEILEAQNRNMPTVSSAFDKILNVNNDNMLKETETEKISNNNEDIPLALDRLRPTVCYRCGYTYHDIKDYKKHKKSCEGELSQRQCQLCEVSASGEQFSRHILDHIRNGKVMCMYCNGIEFQSASDLAQHFNLHVHEQFSYPTNCCFCNVTMYNISTALHHLTEEHDPNHPPFESLDYECEKCKRKFHGERGLGVHMNKCNVSSTSSSQGASLGKPCQVCTKALSPETFTRHLINHLEEGLFVCSLCNGKPFPSSAALSSHLEEHVVTLSYPMKCPMCSYILEESSSSLIHLKEEHGFGDIPCNECDMRYNFTHQLHRHIDIVHKVCMYAKRRYICWICRAYDHVKKETLMNHFQLSHCLTREAVDEKVMIRTRGLGTMPTTQFIPTKPLGNKDNEFSNKKHKSKELKILESNILEICDNFNNKTKAKGLANTNIKDGENIEKLNYKEVVDLPKAIAKYVSNETSEKVEISTPYNTNNSPNLLDENSCKASSEKKSDEDNQSKLTMNESSKNCIEYKMDKILTSKKDLKGGEMPNNFKSTENINSKASELKNSNEVPINLKKSSSAPKAKKLKIKIYSSDSDGSDSKEIICNRITDIYKCKKCDFQSKLKAECDEHQSSHEVYSDQDEFVCKECGDSFVVQPSLYRHMFFVHKIKQPPQNEFELDQMKLSENSETEMSLEKGKKKIIKTKKVKISQMKKKVKSKRSLKLNEETLADKDLKLKQKADTKSSVKLKSGKSSYSLDEMSSKASVSIDFKMRLKSEGEKPNKVSPKTEKKISICPPNDAISQHTIVRSKAKKTSHVKTKMAESINKKANEVKSKDDIKQKNSIVEPTMKTTELTNPTTEPTMKSTELTLKTTETTMKTTEPPTMKVTEPPTMKNVETPKTENTEPPKNKNTESPTQKTAEPPTKKTAEPPTKKTAEPPTKKTTEPPAKKTAEPPTKKTAEPPSKKTTEPPTKKTAEPPTKITAEPPTKKTTEPPTKKTAEPPTKITAEPPTKKTTEPPTKKMAEPPTKKTAEPPTKKTAEPIKIATEPIMKTTDQTHKTAEPHNKKPSCKNCPELKLEKSNEDNEKPKSENILRSKFEKTSKVKTTKPPSFSSEKKENIAKVDDVNFTKNDPSIEFKKAEDIVEKTKTNNLENFTGTCDERLQRSENLNNDQPFKEENKLIEKDKNSIVETSGIKIERESVNIPDKNSIFEVKEHHDFNLNENPKCEKKLSFLDRYLLNNYEPIDNHNFQSTSNPKVSLALKTSTILSLERKLLSHKKLPSNKRRSSDMSPEKGRLKSLSGSASEDDKSGKTNSSKEKRLRRGEQNVVMESSAKCSVCKGEFPSEVQLERHMRSHGMAFLKMDRKKKIFTPNSPLHF